MITITTSTTSESATVVATITTVAITTTTTTTITSTSNMLPSGSADVVDNETGNNTLYIRTTYICCKLVCIPHDH